MGLTVFRGERSVCQAKEMEHLRQYTWLHILPAVEKTSEENTAYVFEIIYLD